MLYSWFKTKIGSCLRKKSQCKGSGSLDIPQKRVLIECYDAENYQIIQRKITIEK